MVISRAYPAAGGGGGTLKDKQQGESNAPASSEDALRDAVGANATLDLGVDADTGEASFSLGSKGGGSTPGNTTAPAEEQDDVTVTTFGGSTSTDTVQETSQAVENATDGLAFGDDDVDDIGTGEGVSRVESDGEGSSSEAQASTPTLSGPMAELPVSPRMLAIGLGVLGLLYVGVQ